MPLTTANCIRRLALLGLLAAAAPAAVLAQAVAPRPAAPARAETAGGHTYVVFLAGRVMGREEVLLVAQADGFILRGSSRLNPPVATAVRHLEVRYDARWQARSLELDATVQGKDVTLKTSFADGKATNHMTEGGEATDKIDDVSADAVVLPNIFFGSYAALAARLQFAQAGTELKAYIAPQAEIPVIVTAVAEERIETPKRAFAARRYSLTFKNPAGEVAATRVGRGGVGRLRAPERAGADARSGP